MYKKIVATLDGSEHAECAIPYAEDLAQKSNAEVILLTVEEAGPSLPSELYQPHRDQPGLDALKDILRKEAADYLAKKEKELQAKGIKARSALLSGDVATQIIDFADKEGADIIIMATHGRSGLARWAYGSVADKVLKGASVPTMLVRCAVPPP